MITAGITAAVAAILGLFGIKPGAYLVFVAGGVKIALVLLGTVYGVRWMNRRGRPKPLGPKAPPDRQTQAATPAPGDSPP